MSNSEWGRLRELARNVSLGRHETDTSLAREAAAELPGLLEHIGEIEAALEIEESRTSQLEAATGGAVEVKR